LFFFRGARQRITEKVRLETKEKRGKEERKKREAILFSCPKQGGEKENRERRNWTDGVYHGEKRGPAARVPGFSLV